MITRLSHGVERRTRRLQTRLRNARPSIQIVKETFTSPIVGCEVGVFRGKHAVQMLTIMPNLKMLYLVDPYTMYEGYDGFENPSTELLENAEQEAHRRLEPFKDRVTWIRERFDSRHIPKKLDFIYIDGQHTYEAVLHDIQHAKSLVKPGGIIAGHDYYPAGHYLNPKFGVGEAVRDIYGTTIYLISLFTQFKYSGLPYPSTNSSTAFLQPSYAP